MAKPSPPLYLLLRMFHHRPVLVVEDEESDALLLELAMKEARVPNRLVVVRDGQELIEYLTVRTPFTEGVLPALLLLDLKMPRMDGFQVLSWLQRHPEFRAMPVIIFSASMCPGDIEKARQMGAHDYLEKPSEFAKLVDLARLLRRRWLAKPPSVVPAVLPSRSSTRGRLQRLVQ